MRSQKGTTSNMAQIHWFPGHMKKALNEIEAKIKLVDIVIEILDARAPLSSINPEFEKRVQNKKRIFVLSKSDLADPIETQKWEQYFPPHRRLPLPRTISKRFLWPLYNRQTQI